jgi:hypothetical protein
VKGLRVALEGDYKVTIDREDPVRSGYLQH